MKVKAVPSLTVAALSISVATLTLACALATNLVGRVSLPASRTGTSGLIVFTGVDGNIYTIDHTGGNQQAITQDASLSPTPGETSRVYQSPTWAPDGDHLAFIELSGAGQSGFQARLLSASVRDRGQVEAFASDQFFPFYLYWSPDSQKISFLSNGTAEGGLALHLAYADGHASRLVQTGQPFYWDWAPRENEIVIHTGGSAAANPAARLAFLTMDDPFISQELDLHPSSFQAPAWSPGGGDIALAVETDAGDALVLQERDSQVQRTIAEIDGQVAFAWSPDSSRLAYMTPAQDLSNPLNRDLFVLQPTRPDEKSLLATGSIFGYFWSPDSQHLAIFQPTLAEPSSRSANIAQQSPRLFMSLDVIDLDTGETRHLYTFAPTEAFLNLLPFYDQYQRSITFWSPDSREIVLAAVEEAGQPGIYVINALEGSSTRLASGDLAFWSWR